MLNKIKSAIKTNDLPHCLIQDLWLYSFDLFEARKKRGKILERKSIENLLIIKRRRRKKEQQVL
jgi:hypothetical protein